MRITILAVNKFESDPRSRVTTFQLQQAGHDLRVVRFGTPTPDNDFVDPNQPPGSSVVSRLTRRVQSTSRRNERRDSAMIDAVVGTEPELIVPTTEKALPLATLAASRGNSFVSRAPQWPMGGPYDLIDNAPGQPQASHSVRSGLPFHTPQGRIDRYRPSEGRHRGTRIGLAYRKTESNPGRYLEAALGRAGAKVDLYTDRVDFATIPSDTDAIVFVEGPYPGLEVIGTTPDIPIGFWIHHGESHLAANLRLAERYRADLILLAHSWHLTHLFRQPVQRFPFGMAPEIFDGSTPIADRRYDVAMVGAHIRGGGPYPLRGQITRSLEEALDTTAFEQDLPPHRMVELYEQARIIPNEGGTRHFPITMRVLEAVGAGALLVSQPTPGLEQILTPGEHFVELEEDVVTQFRALLNDPRRIQSMTDAALNHVAGQHLYDHRVDELLAGLTQAEKLDPLEPGTDREPLERLVDQDVEVQRVLVAPGTDLVLPGREVWAVSDDIAPGSYDAVVFRGRVPPAPILNGARRYIYAETSDQQTLNEFIAARHPQAESLRSRDLIRVDLKAASYRAK